MQVMVIEFARHVLGSDDANSSEFDRSTPHPVIDLLPEQRGIGELGGTMRLGLYPCHLVPGTHAAAAYGTPLVEERHRHRFELNNAYRDALGAQGMAFSGVSPDGAGEIAEIADHPFGEAIPSRVLSQPNRPHPLFQRYEAVGRKPARIEALSHPRRGRREFDRSGSESETGGLGSSRGDAPFVSVRWSSRPPQEGAAIGRASSCLAPVPFTDGNESTSGARAPEVDHA
jgi:hypothetical protein